MVIWIFVILALMWLAWFIITNSQHVTTIETPPDIGIRIVATHPYHNEYIRLEVQSKTGRYCRCDIAGIRYCGNLSNYVGEFTGWLVAEPENPHDQNAIKITHADGKKVGYIPRNYEGDEIRFNINEVDFKYIIISNLAGHTQLYLHPVAKLSKGINLINIKTGKGFLRYKILTP